MNKKHLSGVSLYAKSGVPEDGGELQAEIAIGEEDNTFSWCFRVFVAKLSWHDRRVTAFLRSRR